LRRKRLPWQDMLAKFAILFAISAILVLGFWFHSMFYQYGLITLLAIGGLVTLIIIFVTSRTLSLKPLIGSRAKCTVEFSEKEKSAILDGKKRTHVMPFRGSGPPRANTLCHAVCGGEMFASIYITDLRRALLQDVARGEPAPADFPGAEMPHESQIHDIPREKKSEGDPDAFVNVLSFDVETISSGGG